MSFNNSSEKILKKINPAKKQLVRESIGNGNSVRIRKQLDDAEAQVGRAALSVSQNLVKKNTDDASEMKAFPDRFDKMGNRVKDKNGKTIVRQEKKSFAQISKKILKEEDRDDTGDKTRSRLPDALGAKGKTQRPFKDDPNNTDVENGALPEPKQQLEIGKMGVVAFADLLLKAFAYPAGKNDLSELGILLDKPIDEKSAMEAIDKVRKQLELKTF